MLTLTFVSFEKRVEGEVQSLLQTKHVKIQSKEGKAAAAAAAAESTTARWQGQQQQQQRQQ